MFRLGREPIEFQDKRKGEERLHRLTVTFGQMGRLTVKQRFLLEQKHKEHKGIRIFPIDRSRVAGGKYRGKVVFADESEKGYVKQDIDDRKPLGQRRVVYDVLATPTVRTRIKRRLVKVNR